MRGNRSRVVVLLAIAGLAPRCAHLRQGEHPPSEVKNEATPSGVISVAAHLAQLPSSPVVGFDVDDTALFSTPSFLFAKGRLVPEPPAVAGVESEIFAWREWVRTLEDRKEALFLKVVSTSRGDLNAWERGQWVQFWNDVNTLGDAYSPPKSSVRQIILFHLKRGDEVVFITARPRATVESLSSKLRSDFGSRVRVEFTEHEPKWRRIREAGIRIYYGDADADMDDAIAGGARAVRVLRSRYSSNAGDTPRPGTKREWRIIQDSDL